MLGLELDPLRAEKRALRTGKGVAWPPLRTMKNHQIFTSLRYTQCLTQRRPAIPVVQPYPTSSHSRCPVYNNLLHTS